ncbi:hypothetical protein I203_108281 [Kwoniella mangroviensis CBS 8507]|uniref:hypothetical protein n=1 Tax=Kwoniella mangroviensis CBS 8507 TaxID=1296122 RepID=UPI00080CE4CF|nr:uncharacterized protein I203_05172 [Kwoniella mangroviensis CBS 8507]OCF65497.1 hypothetical protein I203_05172 [Kwoniella mangroviensis CBS 8507]
MMFTTKIATLSTLIAAANALTINTPASLIECQPTSITFSGGSSSPYYLSILPGGQASASALENLPDATSSPVTWTVDIASGTNITIKITDGSGNIAYSSPVVIQAGSSSSCLGTNSGSSASATGSTSASATSGSSASGSAASAAASGTASSTSRASGSASGSASAASSSSSAASSAYLTKENAGAAAIVMGFVATALGVIA